MAETNKIRCYSVQEYLDFEETTEVRHEYIRGQVFAMSGATEAHNLICGNLYGILFQLLKGSNCRAYQHGMKLRIETTDCFYYPDVFVTCEKFDAQSVFKSSPSFIAEVLSPSTKSIDRREKLVAYRTIDSLQQYVLLHQDRMLIEVYSRVSATEWDICVLHESDNLKLQIQALNLSTPVSAIYEQVTFPPIVKESEMEYEFS